MTQSPPNSNLTPVMRQYQHFKAQYPDAILFFRMGDFFETFYEDAQTCSKVLGITLTSRSKQDNPIPLAGVPVHAVDNYIHKMLKAGYKVAICDQIEDASQAKGIVKRDVVRLVTPGTLTEESLLEERVGNYLAAICFDHKPNPQGPVTDSAKSYSGLAWVDLSTGQFFAQQLQSRHVLDELVRLRPAECLICEDPDTVPRNFTSQLKELIKPTVTTRPAWLFSRQQGLETLTKHFGVSTLEGFGFTESDHSVTAAAVIINYLTETQKTSISHVSQLRKVSPDHFLKLDQTTIQSLEIERTLRDHASAGSLIRCLDRTCTAMGARKFRLWLSFPLTDLPLIEKRQNAVSELLGQLSIRDSLRKILKTICDVERISTRISTARCLPRDFLALANTLRRMPEITSLLEPCQSELLTQFVAQCESLDPIADLIESAIDPDAPNTIRQGGIIRAGFDQQVDHLRSIYQDGQNWLARYQKQLIEKTGFGNLKVGFNRVFGYYVELSNAFRGQLPPEFIRKQTLKNAERYITEELKHYESEALTAQQRCRDLEEKIFQDIRSQVAAQTLHLQQIADAIAGFDCIAALAYLADQQNYCRPQMHGEKELEIIEGRHPVLELTGVNSFIPNDTVLSKNSADMAIITGPNMSGKSTYIRQTALLVLLAHTGSYIPAKSARIGMVDRIFTRVGASDELIKGQSTFMVEMIETANIINNATDRSLVILDEIGRGTSTYDGLSLAWAVAEHIANTIKCRTLFATHYHELTELADLLDNVKNENVAVREWKDQVIFLHKIIPGRTDKSYGVHVARLAGIPQNVITRAGEILDELESNFSREAQLPQFTAAAQKNTHSAGQMLFDYDKSASAQAILEKIRNTDLNQLTPIQAVNFLQQVKEELEK